LARSRAAEHLLNLYAGRWGMSLEAHARGTSDIWQGEPLMPPLRAALELREVRCFSAEPSRQVTRQDVQRAAVIVCMAREPFNAMYLRYPEAQSRMYLFNALAYGLHTDVIDPLPARKPGDPLPTVGDLEDMVKIIEAGIEAMMTSLYPFTLGARIAR
jgi:protein-tyrosine-phosphatase